MDYTSDTQSLLSRQGERGSELTLVGAVKRPKALLTSFIARGVYGVRQRKQRLNQKLHQPSLSPVEQRDCQYQQVG
jgi:hypothetical protein